MINFGPLPDAPQWASRYVTKEARVYGKTCGGAVVSFVPLQLSTSCELDVQMRTSFFAPMVFQANVVQVVYKRD
jgi:hypothetical protein